MSVSPVVPPTLEEVRAAEGLLADVIVRTPLVPVDRLEGVWLKPEVHQPAGSFKVRGVYHAVARLDADQRAAGVSTVSAGNTAKALAWSARRFGVSARSLMPEGAPKTKVDAMRALGGEPVLVPVDELFAYLKEHGWESEPYAFVHPWTERQVMIGHGTLGLELAADLPDLATVYVPVGGGGLFGGVGSALRVLRPDVRLVAVEPESCPALRASLDAGRPAQVACQTFCDGVAVPYMTEEVFPVLSALVDDVVLVTEEEVRQAIRDLAHGNHLIAEGAGALAVAAAKKDDAPRPAVCLLTGGSIDTTELARILGT